MNLINRRNIFLLEEIVKRNFSAKYKDSILGILWSFIKPLLLMILLTIIFSTVFGRQIENYPVYVLSGKCIYDFFSASTNLSLNAIKGNENILKRTPSPKHIFVLGAVLSEFINFLISLIILFAVMIITHANFYIIMPLAIIPLISLLMGLIGTGLILSIFCVYFTDLKHLWGVIVLALMYASAIFYPIEIVPDYFYNIMVLNPIFWIINQFRHFIYMGSLPDILNIINSILLSAIILVLGIIIFKKYEKNITTKL